jgi:PBSX family phage terminase large subunit
MELQVASNFEFILDNFSFEKSERQEKQGFVLEGGSGSAKTWDLIQWTMYYCQINKNRGKDILIFRQTYADLKKTVLKDFIKVLKKYGIYRSEHHTKSHPQAYNLYGNMIYFTGLDGAGSHGERHDIIWGNEGMELSFEDFKQLNQRCSEAFFIDYNPSFTEHWIYDNIIKRKDTVFFKSTQLDNPFLPQGQRDEIRGYEPYLEGSYQIEGNNLTYRGKVVSDSNQPPPHPINVEAGTADEFMWKVYGLGLRGAMKGIIFPLVTYIDEFPSYLPNVYGMDFGFTVDPTTLVKYGQDGKSIYLELLLYHPIDNPEDLSETLDALDISKYDPITADSSDKHTKEKLGSVFMVRDLFGMGWEISKVSKTKNIMFWLAKMKKFKIHIVKNKLVHHARKEQENYRLKEINGMAVNQPADGWEHFWDGARYAHMSHDINNFSVESN